MLIGIGSMRIYAGFKPFILASNDVLVEVAQNGSCFSRFLGVCA